MKTILLNRCLYRKSKRLVLEQLLEFCYIHTGKGNRKELMYSPKSRSLTHLYGPWFTTIAWVILLVGCAEKDTRFTQMDPKDLGIEFENQLSYTEEFNPYTYRNFYNGAGVALGDINNDGLIDLYFTGNMTENKLYLNKGNWEFEDITDRAGVACSGVWSAGATWADINGDGLLDLYVTKSGMPGGQNRNNELFINQGDLTFKESSAAYGLDVVGLSVQAAFFDYDADGDLDCYLLNNSIRSVGAYDLIEGQREKSHPDGNRLLENRDGFFVNVSEEAGIYTSAIGFGLGITLSDFNGDHRPDLFISNDFFEKDYLYLNTGQGGFKEVSDQYFSALSMGSMGADAADLDNDLLPDLMVTEMLPETLERQKTKQTYESWDKFSLAGSKGYHKQYPRNALQRNLGQHGFAEISRMTGLSATEWSWAALLFDMDNDGLRDVYVSNGIYKDLLDRDYLAYMANEEKVRQMIQEDDEVITKLIDLMPSKAVPNAVYRNKGDWEFEDMRETWGMQTPSFSNGSAYGDLDNDGDLDLVVNNVNMPPFIYKNNTDQQANALQLSFKALGKNTFGVGTKAIVYYGGNKSMGEQFPSRGFMSASPNRLHFGLGAAKKVDSIEVIWPNRTKSVLKDIAANQLLHIDQHQVPTQAIPETETLQVLQEEIFPEIAHEEGPYIDFNFEQLLPEMVSHQGPALAVGDVNGDGYDDVYLGGGKKQSGQLVLSKPDGTYTVRTEPFAAAQNAEEVVALFVDTDRDGDLDLYVGTGGKAFSKFDSALKDLFYLNDGRGNFKAFAFAIEEVPLLNTGVVISFDADADNDPDLWIAGRYDTETYGLPSSGYLLINDGLGRFSLSSSEAFKDMGMVRSAVVTDLNADSWPDIIASGDWMNVEIYLNRAGEFERATDQFGMGNTRGMWGALHLADLNGDGIKDLIAGNVGTNSFYQVGMGMWVADFDQNGRPEQIFTYQIDEQDYPIHDKDELSQQLPYLKKNRLLYADYSTATLEKLLGQEAMESSTNYRLNSVSTSAWSFDGDQLTPIKLPGELQYAHINAIALADHNKDGIDDLIFGGNQYLIKPRFGASDASSGWAIPGGKQGYLFNQMPLPLGIKGNIRAISPLDTKAGKRIIFGINNKKLSILP